MRSRTILFVVCAGSAYKRRPSLGSSQYRFANFFILQTDRHRNPFHVHANQRLTNIQSQMSHNPLHHHWLSEVFVGRRAHSATGVSNGAYSDLIKIITLLTGSIDHKGTI